MKTLKLLTLSAAIVLSLNVQAKPPRNVADLIKLELINNDNCRGGLGNDPATQVSCDNRDNIDKQLSALGWCWVGENELTSSWQKCPKLRK